MSIKIFLPLLMMMVFSFTYTFQQSVCDREFKELYQNKTFFSLYTSFIQNNLTNCINALFNSSITVANKTVAIQCDSSGLENLCGQSWSLGNDTFSGKWCTYSFSLTPTDPVYSNASKSFKTGFCVPPDCDGNSTQINSSFVPLMARWSYKDFSSTTECPGGGFPVWAIIVIVLVVIAVVVIIVVVIVVMLRRKSSYQNI